MAVKNVDGITALRETKISDSVMRSSDAIIVMLDKDFRIIHFNSVAEQMSGYTASEVMGRPVHGFYQDGDPESVTAVGIPGCNDRFQITKNIFWRLKNGQTRELKWCETPILDGRGLIDCYFCSALDVVERTRMEKAFYEIEERFRVFFQLANDPMFVHSMEGGRPGKYYEVNQAACDLFGYSREEFMEMTPNDLDPDITPEILQTIGFNLETYGRFTMETIHRSKAGVDIPVELSMHMFIMNGKPFLMEVARDISKRKETEKALMEAKLAAEMANRAKSQFLAHMSHDIRTPMNAIVGMTEVLLDMDLTPEQTQYVHVLRNAGDTLLTLINDILDLSKVEAGKLEIVQRAFNLQKLVDNVVEILSFRAKGKGIALFWQSEGKIPEMVKGDPDRLSQILFNLAGNAIKFTEEGVVKITVASLDRDGSDKEKIRFMVEDTGIGIPEEQLANVFESYVQGEAASSNVGSGLGLAICKHLVEMMGGEITLTSVVGKGSVFSFSIQLDSYDDRTGPEMKQDRHRDGRGKGDRRILLVEDSEDNRLLFRLYLKNWPYQVDGARNGQEAVEKYLATPYDLILMDMRMPVMDGYAATREIRRIEADQGGQKIPILALTANALKEDVEDSLRAGCDEHINKPIKKAFFLETIQKYLG